MHWHITKRNYNRYRWHEPFWWIWISLQFHMSSFEKRCSYQGSLSYMVMTAPLWNVGQRSYSCKPIARCDCDTDPTQTKDPIFHCQIYPDHSLLLHSTSCTNMMQVLHDMMHRKLSSGGLDISTPANTSNHMKNCVHIIHCKPLWVNFA